MPDKRENEKLFYKAGNENYYANDRLESNFI